MVDFSKSISLEWRHPESVVFLSYEIKNEIYMIYFKL